LDTHLTFLASIKSIQLFEALLLKLEDHLLTTLSEFSILKVSLSSVEFSDEALNSTQGE